MFASKKLSGRINLVLTIKFRMMKNIIFAMKIVIQNIAICEGDDID